MLCSSSFRSSVIGWCASAGHSVYLVLTHPYPNASFNNSASAFSLASVAHKWASKMLPSVLKLNEDHPDWLASEHELARAYQADGKFDAQWIRTYRLPKLLWSIVRLDIKFRCQRGVTAPVWQLKAHAVAVMFSSYSFPLRSSYIHRLCSESVS